MQGQSPTSYRAWMIMLIGTFLLVLLLVAVPVVLNLHRHSNRLSEPLAESALQVQQLIETDNVQELNSERAREIHNRIERLREFNAHTDGEKRVMDMLSAESALGSEARYSSRFDTPNANEEWRNASKKVQARLEQCNADVRAAIRTRVAESLGECTVPTEYK